MTDILSVYNEIIFGELGPWLPKNKDQAKFYKILNPLSQYEESDVKPIDNVAETFEYNPILVPMERSCIGDGNGEHGLSIHNLEELVFNGLLYKSNEPSFDYKTEYYFKLVEEENSIILAKLNELLVDTQLNFPAYIKKVFTQIKIYTFESHRKYKSFFDSGTGANGYARRLSLDELYELKINKCIFNNMRAKLMQLLLDVSRIFSAFINDDFVSEHDIYVRLLQEPPLFPDAFDLQAEIFFCDSGLLLEDEEYSFDKVRVMLVDIISYLNLKNPYVDSLKSQVVIKEELISRIELLENLMFVKNFNLSDKTISYDYFSSYEEMNACFNIFKEDAQARLKELPLSKDRISFIDDQLEDLSNLIVGVVPENSEFKQSLIRKAVTWLNTEKESCQANLSLNFKESDLVSVEKIPTNFTVKEMSAFLYLLCESGDIKECSKESIFRTTSVHISSKNRVNISTESLNHHFYSPDFVALKTLGAKMRKWLELIEKYK